MELRSEEKQEKKNKGKKLIVALIITLIIFIIIISVLIVVLQQAENDKTKLSIDGKLVKFSQSLILEDSLTEQNYYSISEMAGLVGYDFYNGEYKKILEDKTKCYVKCENEIAMFEQGKDVIYKNNAINKENFDEYKISSSVKANDGILYATKDAIETAFNIILTHNDKNNTYVVNTLPYLVKTYKDSITSYGYMGISEDFATQKALAKQMLVVNKDDKYGVISTNSFSSIIGNKYDKIVYEECTNEFFVTNGKKMGMINPDGQTRNHTEI